MILQINSEIALSKWKTQYKNDLLFHANEGDITRFLGDTFPFPYTEEHAQKWIEFNMKAEEVLNFAILKENECIGGVGIIKNSDVYFKTIEIGYWIGEKYQNMGIASIIVSFFADYCFENFNINRIEAKVFSGNEASQRVLQKCGFTLEAQLRENVYKNGRYLDSLIYGLLRNDLKDDKKRKS